MKNERAPLSDWAPRGRMVDAGPVFHFRRPLAHGISLYVVMDLSNPQSGLIRVEAMKQLCESMTSDTPAPMIMTARDTG
jgi:hypothetical protein